MNIISNMKSNLAAKRASYQAMDSKDKRSFWGEALINNAMYILIIVAIIYTQIQNSYFLKPDSIVNIISLSAANIPIACGIAGCIVLTGTDLSAGRVVGLTACISASLLQSVDYATKMFPKSAGYADLGCNSGSYYRRRNRRLRKWIFRSKILPSSVHRYSGYAAYRIRSTSDVHHDQRKQRSAAVRS